MAEQALYELITYDGSNETYKGKKVRRYFSDGSLRNDRGHTIEKLPNNGHDITAENSRDYARKRWEKYQNAAAEAVRAEVGSIAPGGSTPFAAWGVLVADQATKLLDYQKPRVRELQHLGQIIGAVPTVYDGGEQEQTGVTMSEGVASQLLDLLNGMVRQDVDVIDG